MAGTCAQHVGMSTGGHTRLIICERYKLFFNFDFLQPTKKPNVSIRAVCN